MIEREGEGEKDRGRLEEKGFGLVWTIFKEGAYLTFKSIFHKTLNLF